MNNLWPSLRFIQLVVPSFDQLKAPGIVQCPKLSSLHIGETELEPRGISAVGAPGRAPGRAPGHIDRHACEQHVCVARKESTQRSTLRAHQSSRAGRRSTS